MPKTKNICRCILTSILLSACATHPDKMQAAYVSPVEYQNYTCEQIALEMRYVSQRATELYGTLDKEAGNDTAQMTLGLILFWPALFFLEGGDDAVNISLFCPHFINEDCPVFISLFVKQPLPPQRPVPGVSVHC